MFPTSSLPFASTPPPQDLCRPSLPELGQHWTRSTEIGVPVSNSVPQDADPELLAPMRSSPALPPVRCTSRSFCGEITPGTQGRPPARPTANSLCGELTAMGEAPTSAAFGSRLLLCGLRSTVISPRFSRIFIPPLARGRLKCEACLFARPGIGHLSCGLFITVQTCSGRPPQKF